MPAAKMLKACWILLDEPRSLTLPAVAAGLSVCSGVTLLASLPDWLLLLLMPAAAAGTSVCVDMRLLASRLARAALQLLLARSVGLSVRSGPWLLAKRPERAALLLLSAPARGLSVSSGVELLAGLLGGLEVGSLLAEKWANAWLGSSGWEPQPERWREALPAGEVAWLKRPEVVGCSSSVCAASALLRFPRHECLIGGCEGAALLAGRGALNCFEACPLLGRVGK